MRKALITAVLAVVSATTAEAQTRFTFETPSFMSPRAMDDIGVYLTFSDFGCDSAVSSCPSRTGLQGIWRQSGNLNLGVRAGVADLADAGSTILVGAELYGGLNSLAPGSGIDIAWTLSAGAIFGDNVTIGSLPLGVSVGRQLETGSVRVTPYVHPRVSLDLTAIDLGNGEEDTDTDVAFTVDIGADLSLGDRLILRAGASLGDREAYGIGIALRWPRGVSVVR